MNRSLKFTIILRSSISLIVIIASGCSAIPTRSHINADSLKINGLGEYITTNGQVYSGNATHYYENSSIGAITSYKRGQLRRGRSYNRNNVINGKVNFGTGWLNWCYPDGKVESMTFFRGGKVSVLKRYDPFGETLLNKRYRW